MHFLKKLFGRRSGGDDDRHLTVYVLSHRCREPLSGRVDLLGELSEDEGDAGYYVRKVFHTSGRNRCFDQVEVQLWFDQNKMLVRQEVTGGRRLEEAEYQAELARFTASITDETEPDSNH